MYITTTGTDARYTVLDASIRADEVRYRLADAPTALGERVALWTADGGLCLRSDVVSDWPYPRVEGGTVVLSRRPPAEPESPQSVSVEDDLLETALDHEARLAALELLRGGED